MTTTLHCQWYVSKDASRNAEIEFCVRKNLENGSIDRFVWYVPAADRSSVPAWLRGEVVEIEDRLTYGHVLRAASDPRSLHILINTDIVVPEISVAQLRQRMCAADVCCLTRWESAIESYPAGRIVKRANSQDLWAWWGDLCSRDESLPEILDGIALGVPGCDNRVAYEFSCVGTVINPAHSIRTYHIHASRHRTYSSATEPIPKPYLRVELTE